MWMIQEVASRKDTGDIVVFDAIITFCKPDDPDQMEADYAKMEAEIVALRERCERAEAINYKALLAVGKALIDIRGYKQWDALKYLKEIHVELQAANAARGE
jgi:hypothetical protein